MSNFDSKKLVMNFLFFFLFFLRFSILQSSSLSLNGRGQAFARNFKLCQQILTDLNRFILKLNIYCTLHKATSSADRIETSLPFREEDRSRRVHILQDLAEDDLSRLSRATFLKRLSYRKRD